MKTQKLVLNLVLMIFTLSLHTNVLSQSFVQLDHKRWGGPGTVTAVKRGISVDTVFIGGQGAEVRAFAVSHASPGTPTELTALKFEVLQNHYSIALHPTKSLIFVATGRGLIVRDYKTSTNYTTPSSLPNDYFTSVALNSSGTIAYVGAAMYMCILDVTDPSNISLLRNETIPMSIIRGFSFKGSGGTDTLFIAGSGFKGLRMYNVTNPSSPVLLGASIAGDSVANSQKDFYDVAVTGDSVYVAQSDSGIRSFPRSNIAFEGNLTYFGKTNRVKSVKGDSFLVIPGIDGFRMRNVRTLQTSLAFAQPSLPGGNDAVAGENNLLYCVEGILGFSVLDISNPMSPSQQGLSIFLGDNTNALTGDDRNYAYQFNGYDGIRIINLNTHGEVGFFKDTVRYTFGDVLENTLVASYTNGFHVFNVSNPASPQLLARKEGLAGSVARIKLIKKSGLNDTLYAALVDTIGIKVFNIQNPQNIVQVGSTIGIPKATLEMKIVEIFNDYYIMLAYSSKFAIYKFSGNTTPVIQDSVTLTLSVPAFDTDGRFIYVKTSSCSLQVFNMSNPMDIIQTSNCKIPNATNIYEIFVSGKRLIARDRVLASTYKIMAVDISNPANPMAIDSINFYNPKFQLMRMQGLGLLVAAWGDGYFHFSMPYGKVRVRIPVATGMPKDTLTLTVKILDNPSALGVMSMENFLTFDTNYVKFVSLQRGSAIGTGDSLLYNLISSSPAVHTDTLKIVRADTGSVSFGTDCSLVKIKLRIKDNAPVQPLLQKTFVRHSQFIFSEGYPGADYQPGRINIVPRFGDANKNGNVSAADASYILQATVGIVNIPSTDYIVADVSNNGEIRAYDAALVLKRLVNPSYKYPVETFYGLKQASAPLNGDAGILVTMENAVAEAKSEENVTASTIYTISMKNIKEVWSAEMIVDFGEGQKFLGYQLQPRSDKMSVQYRQEGTKLYISMAGDKPITENGQLIQLLCQVTDAEAVKPIMIEQFMLNETLVEKIEGALTGLPRTYALGQNYPNPFNPATQIRYQLPNQSKVTLIIYNLLGQQVKTLINMTLPAGYYVASWDGKDDRGLTAASGVYFYRIQAGSFIKTKKMLFMK